MNNKVIKTTIFTSIVLGILFVFSMCKEQNSSESAAHVNADTVYFSKYIDYQKNDSTINIYTTHYDSGSIEVYGDVINVKKSRESKEYFVMHDRYDVDNCIYFFYTIDATITFDPFMSIFKIHYDEFNSGSVFYIESER